MKTLLTALVSLLLTSPLVGQEIEEVIIIEEVIDMGEDFYTQAQKDSLYLLLDDFMVNVDSIALVSLSPICRTIPVNRRLQPNDSLTCMEASIIGDSSLNTSRFKEYIPISKANQDSISQLLKKSIGFPEPTECLYQPRHGIVFYGKNAQFVAFVEICFECEQTAFFGDFPEMLFNWYQSPAISFFEKWGIKYGLK